MALYGCRWPGPQDTPTHRRNSRPSDDHAGSIDGLERRSTDRASPDHQELLLVVLITTLFLVVERQKASTAASMRLTRCYYHDPFKCS